MTFYTAYYAQCETCGDTCDYCGNSTTAALVIARQKGWQAVATNWIFDGVEVEWDFYCPTHRTDLG